MRFSLNFIKEFVELKQSPADIASSLTMAGMEVGNYERKGNDWVFDAEITTNRYDWLSIVGITKELTALFEGKEDLA